MAEPWETDNDTSFWDPISQDYSTPTEREAEGQTIDEPWEYYTDDYGYTEQDDAQSTGYSTARITETKRIQTALARATFNPGTIDGIWGPKTCSAMMAFQKSRWGSAKNGWLDVDTWAALGFDASTSMRFEDVYGMSCGGAPPAGWTGAGSGTNVRVTLSDIQKIQYALGVLTTGVFDKATCEALFVKQRALGINSTALSKQLFETLGFTTSDAQRLTTQIGQGCSKYAGTSAGGGGGTVTPKKPNGGTDPAVIPAVEPMKAGLSGWWILGSIALVAVGGYLVNKNKGSSKSRKGRR